MTSTQTPAPARITWWVISHHDENGRPVRIRRTSTMRGRWDFEATCSCGWDSRTGGALERAIRDAVWEHKFLDH